MSIKKLLKDELIHLVETKDKDIEAQRQSYEATNQAMQKKLQDAEFRVERYKATVKTLVNLYGKDWDEN